jgi:hypothetical protein
MATEIKDWLDLRSRDVRARLAKELIALANHGGGYLLLGFAEKGTGWTPSGSCPFDLENYSQDEINNILKRHSEPVFECAVHHIQSSAGGDHVVVVVPGGHIVPIRVDRCPQGSGVSDTYYARRPGPESAPPQDAHDWETLIHRCLDNDHQRQLEGFRRILGLLQAEPTLAERMSEISTGRTPLMTWTEESLDRLRDLDA